MLSMCLPAQKYDTVEKEAVRGLGLCSIGMGSSGHGVANQGAQSSHTKILGSYTKYTTHLYSLIALSVPHAL